ncbi:MAG: hypothetical protein ACTSUX_10330 [Promethearchaeota archaeon]
MEYGLFCSHWAVRSSTELKRIGLMRRGHFSHIIMIWKLDGRISL